MRNNRIFTIILFFLICKSGFSQDSSYRVAKSLYPFSSKPDTLYLTSENYSYPEKISLLSMMGVLAKTKPRIVRDISNHGKMVREAGIVVSDRFYLDYPGLVQQFSNQ